MTTDLWWVLTYLGKFEIYPGKPLEKPWKTPWKMTSKNKWAPRNAANTVY